MSKGHALMTARLYPGAIQAYQEEVASHPRDPLGYYFLGEAYVAAGEYAEADAAFSRGVAAAADNDDVHARLLFVLADLRERQGRWVDAKRGWEAYGEFVGTHPNGKSYAITAAERAKVIGTHIDLETKYGAVKQRAEQRVKETGSSGAAVGGARGGSTSVDRLPASQEAQKKK